MAFSLDMPNVNGKLLKMKFFRLLALLFLCMADFCVVNATPDPKFDVATFCCNCEEFARSISTI